MPNIEIHGLGSRRDSVNEIATFSRIREKLEATEFADKVVVTLCNDNCWDLKRKDATYLRILSSDPADSQKLVELLAPLKMDIEVVRLESFHASVK